MVLTPFTMITNNRNAKKNVYQLNIQPKLSTKEIDNFNKNVLNNVASDEYQKYLKISDGAQQASHSLDEYYGQCVKLNTLASREGYTDFVHERILTRLYSKDGLDKVFKDLNALRGKVQDTHDVYTDIQTQWTTSYGKDIENAMSTGMSREDAITLLAGSNQDFKNLNDQLKTAETNYKDASAAQEMYINGIAKGRKEVSDYVRNNPDKELSYQEFTRQTRAQKIGNFAKGVGSMFANAALSMGIGMVLSLIVSGIQSLIEAEKNRRKAAIEASEALEEENNAMASQEERIKSLRKELASGTLSEEEAYNARKELIEIQSELQDSYGKEAEGIDLVNGSLEEQLGLLKNISKEKAKDYIVENAKAIEDARNKLQTSKIQDIYWGRVTPGTDDRETKIGIQETLYDYFDKYAKDTGKITLTGDDKTDYNIKGTIKDLINAWDSAYDYLKEYGKKTGIDVTEALSNISKNYINKLDDKYGEAYDFLYNNVAPQEIAQDDNLNDYYKELTDAIEEYNEAIASGESPDTAIDKIYKFREQLLNDEVTDQYGNQITDEVLTYFSDMFTKYIDSVNVSNFKSYLEGLSKNQKDALSGSFDTMTDLDVKNIENNTMATKEQLTTYERLKSFAEEYNISIEDAIDAMTSLGFITGDVASQAERTATAFEKMVEEISDAQTGIEKFNSAYEKILTGEYLTADEVNELIQLNPKLVDKLIRTENGYTIAINDLVNSRKSYTSEQLDSQREEINALQKEADGYNEQLKEAEEKHERLSQQLQEQSQQRKQLLETGAVDDENLAHRNGVWNKDAKTVDIVPNTKELAESYTGYIKRLEDGTIKVLGDVFTLDPNAEYVEDMKILSGEYISEYDKQIAATENGIQQCLKQEDEYKNKIKETNDEIKQRRFLYEQTLYSQARNWKSDFSAVYEKYSNMNGIKQTASDEMSAQGFLSVDTIKEIIDSTDNWSECLTEVNGKMQFSAEKYQELIKEETGYNQIISDANKYTNEYNTKISSKTEALKTLAKGYGIVYDESKSYLENLDTIRAKVAATNNVDSTAMTMLDSLENEYSSLELSLGDCNSELAIFLQLMNQVAEENKIDETLSDFEKNVSEMQHKLNMNQITQSDYNEWYSSEWRTTKNGINYDSLNETSKNSYDSFDETEYSQRVEEQQKLYEKEKTNLDNALEDKVISYQTYYKRIQALNEKYYGSGTLLGNTEDGKETYKSNIREFADAARNTYDDLITRIDRAIDTNIIDNKLLSEIQSVFGENVPGEVIDAINESIKTGKITYSQSSVFAQYLSKEILGSIPSLADDLEDALNDVSERKKSAFDKMTSDLDDRKSLTNLSAEDYWAEYEQIRKDTLEGDVRLIEDNEEAKKNIQLNADKEIYDEKLNLLEKEKEKGNITVSEYWGKRKALAEKYLKNNAALAEEWIDEEIAYAVDAQKEMYEEATSLLERQLKNGEISWSKYIDGLWSKWKKFYAGKKGLEDESNTALNGILDAEKESANEQISALEQQKELVSKTYEDRIQAIEDAQEEMDGQYDDQLNALQSKLELLEKEEETSEKTLEIEEKKKALLDAQRDVYKSLRMVYSGNGQWEVKPTQEALDAVEEAQKEYDEAAKEEANEQLKEKIQDLIDVLQAEKDNYDAEQEKEVKKLNKELEDLQKPFDDLISVLTLIAKDQYNVDPEQLEKLLTSEAGKRALEQVNGEKSEYTETYNNAVNSDLTDKSLQKAIAAELKSAIPLTNVQDMTPEERKKFYKSLSYFKDGVDRLDSADEKEFDPITTASAKAIVEEMAKGNKTVIQQLADIGVDTGIWFDDYFKNLLGVDSSDDATSIINKMVAYLNSATDEQKTDFYSVLDAMGSSVFGKKWETINAVISDYKTAVTESLIGNNTATEAESTISAGDTENQTADIAQATSDNTTAVTDNTEAIKDLTGTINPEVSPKVLTANLGNSSQSSKYIPLSEYSEQNEVPEELKCLIAVMNDVLSAAPILSNLANKNKVGETENIMVNSGNTLSPVINTTITVNTTGSAEDIAQAVGDVVDTKIIKSFQAFYDGYYQASSKTMYGNK